MTATLAPPPLLQACGLSLHAAGRCLLQDLDWQVHPGERWCVIGRNAAGKSTLLRALAGLPVPERSGELRRRRHAGVGEGHALRTADLRIEHRRADRRAVEVHLVGLIGGVDIAAASHLEVHLAEIRTKPGESRHCRMGVVERRDDRRLRLHAMCLGREPDADSTVRARIDVRIGSQQEHEPTRQRGGVEHRCRNRRLVRRRRAIRTAAERTSREVSAFKRRQKRRQKRRHGR